MSKQHIIIGASAAGLGVMNKLRTLDHASTIICIATQKELPYNTCLLADYLGGTRTKEGISKSADFFTKNNITLKLSTKLLAIHPQEQSIELSNGEKLSYDTFFLGMGTSMRIPPISGSTASGVFSFHTLTDTDAINDFITRHNITHAVIVGAGLSGIECSDALVNRGISIDIIEMQDRILPALTDLTAAAAIMRQMPTNVHVHLSTRVEKIDTNGEKVCGVVLDNQEYIATQMVIFAIGCTPNTTVCSDAGITLQNNRVVTNEFMETNIPGIFAGGDMCMVRDLATGKLVPNTLWPDAMQQGMIAAHSMAGVPKPYPGTLVITSSRFYNTTIAHCGNVLSPDQDTTIIVREHDEFYHKFAVKDGTLTGFLLIGNIQSLGVLRSLILQRTKVSSKDLIG